MDSEIQLKLEDSSPAFGLPELPNVAGQLGSVKSEGIDNDERPMGNSPTKNLFARFAYTPLAVAALESSSQTLKHEMDVDLAGPSTPKLRVSPRKNKGKKMYYEEEEEETQVRGQKMEGLRFSTVPLVGKRLHMDDEAYDDVKPGVIEGDDGYSTTQSSPTKRRGQSQSPSKKAKRGVTIYEDLKELPDHLADELDVLFCGINPGQQSAQIGHHYGNPTNHFWSCLHESGFTTTKLNPREDASLPSTFNIGLTNLVSRPSVQQTELSQSEHVSGVPVLLEKVAKYRPRIVCFVSVGIAEVVRKEVLPVARKRSTEKAKVKKSSVGLQPYKMVHSETSSGSVKETLFYAVTSTSGRVVQVQKTGKIVEFKTLKTKVAEVKNGDFDSSDLVPISWPSVGKV